MRVSIITLDDEGKKIAKPLSYKYNATIYLWDGFTFYRIYV